MNIAKMMQQANRMQSDMKALQEKLKTTDVSHSQNGITVTINAASGKIAALSIDPSLLDANDKEIFEDLMTAVYNQAVDKKDALVSEETGKIMGGLQLPPGFQMPF